MLWSGDKAQSGCTSVLSNLAPCLNYITGNSSTPSSSCCSQLSNVVQSSPQCLCTALNGGAASLGININKTRALSLPSACNVQTSPISQCKGANGTPPVGSPADSSDETPASATTTSASGIPSDKRMQMVLAFVLVAALCGGSMAQPSSSCTNVIISMSPCLNYITGNSSTPSSSCCTQLASVVRSQPQCLCDVLNGGASSLGINVNQTQAMVLPGACNVQTPPISQCNASSPANSPAGTPSSSGNGSKTVPSTGGDTSDGKTTELTSSLLLFIVFIASYALTFTII
ncbi:non-specific lipid transfer protein GPI-anchored 5-like [Quercus robur]|uniref:non-specific lipid transfer protein GPI-anchored 5-like n=1 Tax=Quercus robur TaxID=38942 RepID=UPI0021637538|nr:non-specific lipid transfer protein GPI-anchored 5-like [Quercus robur]